MSKPKINKNIPINKNHHTDFLFSSGDKVEENDPDIFIGEGQLCCDVYQDSANIIVKSTMAGVEPNNLDIAVSNDLLTIRGFRQTNDDITTENYYYKECYWGTFSRSIVLPQEVDQTKVKATLKNGILTITLPKKYKTTTIRVKQIEN